MRLNQLSSLLLLFVTLVFYKANAQTDNRIQQVILEKQPTADHGNGYYLNPIIPGNYGDPSFVRIKDDYYLAFSRGDGFIIWHSRDMVNWEPICRHTLPKGFNRVWAVDLQYFDDRFHLYMPVQNYPGKEIRGFGNFVVSAENVEGPWSEPIDIEIPVPDDEAWSGIDPGFIQTPEGEKYLYVNHGYVVKLNDEGNKAVSSPELVYDGWQYPEDWNVECMCLESPKLFLKDKFYYLVSAEGGTSGPSTAHMTVVARSESPTGPWVNSPYNPLVHTYRQDEKWWHQGHGTIFEATDGSWWTVYHGRLNGYTELGRSCLLLPVEWTDDGWPMVKNSLNAADLLPLPKGENVGHGLALSDDFNSEIPGIQWSIGHDVADHLQFGNGKLIMNATGNSLREGTSITVGAVNASFEVTVEVDVNDENTLAGIALGYDGIQTDGSQSTFSEAPEWRKRNAEIPVKNDGRVFMKIKNFRKDLSFYVSDDGKNWQSFGKGLRLHDSYNIRLFVLGNGTAVFQNFTYQGLED